MAHPMAKYISIEKIGWHLNNYRTGAKRTISPPLIKTN